MAMFGDEAKSLLAANTASTNAAKSAAAADPLVAASQAANAKGYGGQDPMAAVSGYGGYQFTDPTNGGLGPAKYQYGQAANYLLQGSQGAQGEIMKGFESLYRHRAEGIAGAQQEFSNRLGGETAAQGLSPELARRMQFAGQQQAQAQIGSAYGEADAGMHNQLAELMKGTGVELANLKRDQISQILNAYLAKKARKASESGGITSLLSGGLGLAGSLFGPGGALAGKAAGTALSGYGGDDGGG